LKRGEPCVYLDVTHLDSEYVKGRFPTIFERCLQLGVDITSEPIPVVPAAHYACGGVLTDLNGATEIPGLYACGEAACTGVHGANRLASNSLLEAMVFGYRAAIHAIACIGDRRHGVPKPRSVTVVDKSVTEETGTARNRLKSVMNDSVGIVRTNRDLAAARSEIVEMSSAVEQLVKASRPDPDLLELRNMAAVAQLIVDSAISRKESRGLHYNTDYPETDDIRWKRDTILKRGS
jgi:L-aspartate oxidase